jgi:starch synthase
VRHAADLAKGIDVLLEVIDHLVGLGGRLALLGAGDPAHGGRAACRRRAPPGRVSLRIGYDEALSHRMQGAAMPSWCPAGSSPAA